MQSYIKNLTCKVTRTQIPIQWNFTKRLFSTIEDLAPEHKQKHKNISSNLKKIIRVVHPDVYSHSHPNVAKVNEVAMTEINNFFSALDEYLLKMNRSGNGSIDCLIVKHSKN